MLNQNQKTTRWTEWAWVWPALARFTLSDEICKSQVMIVRDEPRGSISLIKLPITGYPALFRYISLDSVRPEEHLQIYCPSDGLN
jgi:hypothetical protein